MSHTQNDRKIRSKNGKTFQTATGQETPAFSVLIAAALLRAYGGRHSAVKVVARAVGANERAVRNWFEGKNGPSGEHLVRLIRHSDEMADSVLAMAGKRRTALMVDVTRARLLLAKVMAELEELDTDKP